MSSYDIWDSLNESNVERVANTKVAGKSLILALHELDQRLGDFLKNASTEDEFAARLAFVDEEISDVAYRKCASISDSKAKLARALFDEWQMSKNASNQSYGSFKAAEYQYVKPAGDGKYKIIQKGTGKTLSMHDSKEQAEAAFRAMESNMHSGSVVTADDEDDNSNNFPDDDNFNDNYDISELGDRDESLKKIK